MENEKENGLNPEKTENKKEDQSISKDNSSSFAKPETNVFDLAAGYSGNIKTETPEKDNLNEKENTFDLGIPETKKEGNVFDLAAANSTENKTEAAEKDILDIKDNFLNPGMTENKTEMNVFEKAAGLSGELKAETADKTVSNEKENSFDLGKTDNKTENHSSAIENTFVYTKTEGNVFDQAAGFSGDIKAETPKKESFVNSFKAKLSAAKEKAERNTAEKAQIKKEKTGIAAGPCFLFTFYFSNGRNLPSLLFTFLPSAMAFCPPISTYSIPTGASRCAKSALSMMVSGSKITISPSAPTDS